ARPPGPGVAQPNPSLPPRRWWRAPHIVLARRPGIGVVRPTKPRYRRVSCPRARSAPILKARNRPPPGFPPTPRVRLPCDDHKRLCCPPQPMPMAGLWPPRRGYVPAIVHAGKKPMCYALEPSKLLKLFLGEGYCRVIAVISVIRQKRF